MLPARAEAYIIHSRLSKGRDAETTAQRWNKGYPATPLTVAQVEEVIASKKAPPSKAKPKLSVIGKAKEKAGSKKSKTKP